MAKPPIGEIQVHPPGYRVKEGSWVNSAKAQRLTPHIAQSCQLPCHCTLQTRCGPCLLLRAQEFELSPAVVTKLWRVPDAEYQMPPKLMPHRIIWHVPRAWHAFRTSRLQRRILHSAARSDPGSILLKCVKIYSARRVRVRYSVFVLCGGTCMRVSCVLTFLLTVSPFPAALLCSHLTHIFSQFKLLIYGLTLTLEHAFTLRVHGINIPRA